MARSLGNIVDSGASIRISAVATCGSTASIRPVPRVVWLVTPEMVGVRNEPFMRVG